MSIQQAHAHHLLLDAGVQCARRESNGLGHAVILRRSVLYSPHCKYRRAAERPTRAAAQTARAVTAKTVHRSISDDEEAGADEFVAGSEEVMDEPSSQFMESDSGKESDKGADDEDDDKEQDPPARKRKTARTRAAASTGHKSRSIAPSSVPVPAAAGSLDQLICSPVPSGPRFMTWQDVNAIPESDLISRES